MYGGQVVVPELTPKMRIEIADKDEFVEPTIEAIRRAFLTDNNGK